ncbi:MAG: hypothetical protein RBS07_14345 [Lentimicrobium sp.]|jgi:hypothetical protein|nr:hypothetical protein [Lentimicrobium sp.]
MRKVLFLLVIIVLTYSCKDKCRYVDPPSICGVELKFEILNDADKNIFIEDHSIDSLQILDNLGDTIIFKTNETKKIFQFEIFDCWTETEKFNNTITKNYLLRLNSIEIDTISFEFRPIDPAGECGGTDFEFLKIIYNNRTYDGHSNLQINRIYK